MMAKQNITKWVSLDKNTVLVSLNKTAQRYSAIRIPIEYYSFFEITDANIAPNNRKEIILVYEDTEYPIKITVVIDYMNWYRFRLKFVDVYPLRELISKIPYERLVNSNLKISKNGNRYTLDLVHMSSQ